MDYSHLRLKELIDASPVERKSPDCYALAYHLYQQKRYLEALPLFQLMVQNAPSNPSYWKGLASTLQMLKEFEGAINCYAAAQALTKEKEILLSIYTADCFFALNQIEEGFKALKSAEKEAKKRKDFSALAHIKFMTERWSPKSKNKGA